MLKLQYFSHLMQTVKSLKKCLMLGKIERVKEKSLIRVQLFTTPWTVAYQAPPSMGFSRQEYWSGLPLPSPEKSTEQLYFFTAVVKISMAEGTG